MCIRDRDRIIGIVVDYVEDLKARSQIIKEKLHEETNIVKNKHKLKVESRKGGELFKLFMDSVNKVRAKVYSRASSLKQLRKHSDRILARSSDRILSKPFNILAKFTATDKRAVIYDFIRQPQVVRFLLSQDLVRSVTPAKKVGRRIYRNVENRSAPKLSPVKSHAPLMRHLANSIKHSQIKKEQPKICLLYTSPSPRDLSTSRMPSSACKKKKK
eukprot:TRINITY_DN9831_c0_g2_i3.p1 TRINITY_DN9831_c0_g2~~TRINITY_DN9831_c0_g2_i3.p1  ORF type:complete len:215 (-),score=12.99 TRINITY_DN9831_c0_g2_i3:18-662(-)